MNFGLIEALEKVLAKPSEELTGRLVSLDEHLIELRNEQKQTNRLLAQLVKNTTPPPKPAAVKR